MAFTLLFLSFFYSSTCIVFPGKKDSGIINIQLTHKVGEQGLALNKNYTNNSGELFNVSGFRYYISNIRFNETMSPGYENYFLVDEENPESKNISINLEPATLSSITFLLGVDSLKNVSGAQSGALDPANGMFWTWNTGYIMAKLEGNSPVSSLPGNMFEYHIGGFRGENNVLKEITLPLPANTVLKKNKSITISIEADILKWFRGKTVISIASMPSCTTPGSKAKQVAGNYAAMFSVFAVNE